MKYYVLIFFFFFSFSMTGQKTKKIENDTVLTKILKGLSKKEGRKFKKKYEAMSPEELVYVEYIANNLTSSKKELIANIDGNYQNIWKLKTVYESIIPADYAVYIEFTKPLPIMNLDESINLSIAKKDTTGKLTVLFEERNLELNSNKPDSLLKIIGVDKSNLEKIKTALKAAKCISIRNGKRTGIGFAKNGMAKYSYLLFENKLTADEIKKYNDNCKSIFYKENIVLIYEPGTNGPQCFE